MTGLQMRATAHSLDLRLSFGPATLSVIDTAGLKSALDVDALIRHTRVREGVLLLLEGLGHHQVQPSAGTSALSRCTHVERSATCNRRTLSRRRTGRALVVLLLNLSVL